MWTVLLVEDEIFVRESIRETIRWEDYGFTVVGEAGDGQEGLRLMRELRPDLVLCDIVMPELDGIELLKRARQEGLDSRFVMLTCMGEFEYVRQAMEFGASNYILKLSMSVKALKETLQKIHRELSERAAVKLPDLTAEYEEVWERLCEQSPGAYDYPVPGPYAEKFAVIHAEFGMKANLAEWKAALPPDAVLHQWRRYGLSCVFAWCSAGMSEDRLPAGLPATSAMRVAPAGSVWETWALVLRTLDSSWYEKKTCGEMASAVGGTPEGATWRHEKELMELLELGDSNQLSNFLESLWKEFAVQGTPFYRVLHLADRWLRLCSRVTKQAFYKEELAEAGTHSKLFEIVQARMVKQMVAWNDRRYALTDHPEVNKIIQYLHQHYEEDITVKAMADYVLMRESYVSGLFKKKTGQNMIHYLHVIRIEKAKQELAGSELTVSEISQRVGFLNDNYFNKIFKRLTNLTPSDYRRSKRTGSEIKR